MPKKKKETLCDENLRHIEYYGLQSTFDALYAKAREKEVFTDLMSIMLSRENILLAYRNIKTNVGSYTPGTDGITIHDIGNLSADQVVEKVRFIVAGSEHGYRPKPVRRKDIPKPNGKTRPLGIPCMWDRLIQQCIKQVMEPICEANFSTHSYGFRPNRSVEHAIAETYKRLQLNHLHYVVEFDIKGFFDNVDHSKLIKQIWALGIRDKQLIYILKCILKAPIKMPNGETVTPQKGTPQGGIISPLLANIVLNELDKWVESNWENNPVVLKYYVHINKNGSENKGNGYRALRKTGLKEMWITRYADDFRIFCKSKSEAERTKEAVAEWLKQRLKLEVSEEKTRIVNVTKRYMEFLGFKIKVIKRGYSHAVVSHISDKQVERITKELIEQAKNIVKPRREWKEAGEVHLYNSKVLGIQNYYSIASVASADLRLVNRAVMTVLTNQLKQERGNRLAKVGRPLTEFEKLKFEKSAAVRYLRESGEPIYPIGYIQHRNPMLLQYGACCYTAEGRKGIHNNLGINTKLMRELMAQPLYDRSIEYADNRISLYSAQWGKCAVTGQEFDIVSDIHCHHKTPKWMGGSDRYENLVLVKESVHRLIHAKDQTTIEKYRKICNLNSCQLEKVNSYRKLVGNSPIEAI